MSEWFPNCIKQQSINRRFVNDVGMGYAASAVVYDYPGNASVYVCDCCCHCHQHHQSDISEGEVN